MLVKKDSNIVIIQDEWPDKRICKAMEIMNTWKKSNEELSKFLDEKISEFDVKKKKMFGCPVYFAKDNMLAGVFENDIFIRLSEKDRNKIISQNDEIMPFEPVKGRVMKEYVVLPDSLYNDLEKFHELISSSYDYVSSLPAKQKKKKSNLKTNLSI